MQSNDGIKIYAHPPIVEATIEIRSDSTLTRDNQQKIVTKIKHDYPDVLEINQLDVRIGLDSSGMEMKPEGFRLSSKNQTSIAMILPYSIAVSRLAPYPGWDSFYEDVMSVWKKWRQIQKVIPINRIGVRYINRIDVPINAGSNTINISDYLTVFPENTVYNEEPLSNYLITVAKKTPFKNWFVNINSTVQQPAPLIDRISLILDIDVFYQKGQFFLKEDNDLKDILEEARRIKNEIFQQIITNETEELFNK